MGQPVVAYRSVEPLDVSVLLWVSRLNKLDPDAVPVCPCHQHAADVFRAVVAADCLGFATPLDNLFEGADHSERRQ